MKPLFLALGCTLAFTVPGFAALVPLDLSAAVHYDGVGTQNEINAHPGTTLNLTSLGDHSLFPGEANKSYTNQGSISGTGVALPDDGKIGSYQLVNQYDNGTDYLTKANNIIRINARGTTSSAVVTLAPDEQQQYENFNFLFVSVRSSNAGFNVRSWITATYTDGTSEIVLDTGMVTTEANTPGGTFGSAGIGGQGGWKSHVDSDPSVKLALAMTHIAGIAGSPARSVIREETAGLWEMAEPIALDSTRTLESLEFSVYSSGSTRDNHLLIFAISATPVPEPATAALVGLAAPAVLLRRRRI